MKNKENNHGIEIPGFLFLEQMKENGMLNPVTLAMCLDILSDGNDKQLAKEYTDDLALPLALSMLTKSPFEIPSNEVDGLLRFALTERKMPVGINPEECHVLIAGQTNTGKSTLLKIIFAQALLFDEKQEERRGNGKNNLLALR